MLGRVSLSLLVSLCAAVAVHFSFGPAFVDDLVGYSSTAYVTGLAAIVGRDDNARWSNRAVFRGPIGLAVGVLVLLQLRSWAMFSVPWGEYATSGHSPFFAFPAAGLVAALLLELLAVLTASRTRAAGEAAASEG